ncbi:site-specific integrase [Flavobacterium sp.]|uniref:site-specific integrase n=1 Tax=Flavobacterium sp. TaxID=239 RepID=UPI002CF7E13A|nr:site-specific integrase [Flavobacterium sp.]HSD07889.1 site-specific integrase [Flavobacterium sp.]
MMSIQKNVPHFPTNFPMNFSGKFTAKIVMKKDYVRADGTCALYLQIFLNKEKKKIPCNICVKPIDFDEKKQRIKTKYPFYKDYNLIIEKMLGDLNRIEVNYRLSGIPLTLQKLLEEFENPTSRADFIKFWEDEMNRQKEILKPGTYRQQMTMLNKTKDFKNPLPFYEINEDYIQDLKTYCKKKLKNTDSTVSSLIKSFKKFLHIANRRGIITPISFEDIKNKQFRGNRTYLSPDEIVKLHEFWKSEFISDNYKSILDRFLFSCFTGLRFSDIKALADENIIENTIVFTAQKTNKFQRIPMNASAKKYLHPKIIFKNDFTGEFINRELKDIAKLLGIRKKISFHVARHTFATNFLICGGRVEHLQKILGHSKITDTMIYVHIVENITDIQIHNMDDILEKKPQL